MHKALFNRLSRALSGFVFGAALATTAIYAHAETPVLPGIIGPDERVALESDVWPWTAIGRVNKAGSGHCTGTLVAPDLVVTAGHCLFNSRTKRLHQPQSVKFVAGYDRGDYLAVRDVVEFAFPDCSGFEGPSNNIEKLAFDVAVLKLAEPVTDIEPVKVAPLNRAEPSPTLVLAGYQQDRPYMLSVHGGCSRQNRYSTQHILAHRCDATRGASGGPVLVETDDGWNVVGVHVASLGSARNRPSVLGIASTAVAESVLSGDLSLVPGSCTPFGGQVSGG